MSTLVIVLFAAALILCLALDISLIYALLVGYALFFFYGLYKKHTVKEMLRLSLTGVKTVKNILIVFILIGGVTASWRASGTIAFIITAAAQLITPEIYLLLVFILNALISMLTGTSFGTAATMGVITATIGAAMGIDMLLLGGAVLAGAFFGDRCSPMSTSALLVSELTATNIFDNIKRMLRSALVPFLLSCAFYLALGFLGAKSGYSSETADSFSAHFSLHWTTVLPAALIIILSLFKVKVKLTMLISTLAALAVCVFVQKMEALPLLKTLLMGYTAPDAQLGAMLNGGGLISMLRPAVIILISSSYSGIFDGTGLLDDLKRGLARLSRKLTPFGGALVTSVAAGMVACNQTLGIMLTHQLIKDEFPDNSELALTLEDTAVVTSPLVPWSIASAVPLAAIGASPLSILFAVYLYILPLWRWGRALIERKRAAAQKELPL